MPRKLWNYLTFILLTVLCSLLVINVAFYTKSHSRSLVHQEKQSQVPNVKPVCETKVHQGCLGTEEIAEMHHYPNVYFTGCGEFDHTHRSYVNHLLDANYKTNLQHIAFRYEPISNTGHGIFGAVVIAIDHSTCEQVAIKLSQEGRADNKHSQEHELAIMSHLQQLPGYEKQGLPRLIDHGAFRGATYLVFEVLGIQIHKLLVAGGQCSFGFKVGFIKAFAQRLLRALDFIHQHNISHNDMYYHNLLLRNYTSDHIVADSVTLIDFGRATFKKDWGKQADPGKTPYYAPELVLQTKQWGSSSDLWSFGALMLFLHTSKNVFVPGYKQDWRSRAMRIGQVLGTAMPLNVAMKSHWKNHLVSSSGVLVADFHVNQTEYQGICSFFAERCNPSDKDHRALMAFAGQYLHWDPQRRPTAAEGLASDFLRGADAVPKVYHLCGLADAAKDPLCVCNPVPPKQYSWRRPEVKTFHAHRTHDAGT